jgi:CheY-like chemotaxis protein
MPDVLVVEDKDAKFRDIEQLLLGIRSDVVCVRARTVTEAENLLEARSWSVMVLDISMDINGTSKGALGGGHANLGGLDILDTLFYEGLSIPTIAVTGFDYFIASGSGEESTYIGLDELEGLVRARAQGGYLGCVRYGSEGWQQRFVKACSGIQW